MSSRDPAPSLVSLLEHSGWLEKLARRLVADPSVADDLVQDTWLAALRNPPRQLLEPRGWLARVMRRRARARDPLADVRRARAVVREDSRATDDLVARIEHEQSLAKLVLELEEPYRQVVLQRFYRGLSAAQIARLHAVPPATVRTRLRRALALLRGRMERDLGRDRRQWPLSSLCWVRDASSLGAFDKGVLLMTTMSTKTTIALSAASGALCALAVTQAILPRVRDELTPASAALAAADPGTTHATPAASESSTSDAMASFGAADSRARSESARKPALTNEDLRKLLSSPERIDQIRAIELLIDDGSPAANHILIDAFVGSKDRVLLALLEEAMLESPQAFAPVAMSSFETSDDPEVLARLAQLLAGCVQRRPELEHAVVGPWVGSLEMADEFPSRADAATKGLAALGVQAASELGAYLAESSSAPKGVGSAAWLIAQLPVEHAGVVRDELEHGLRSLDVLDTSAIEGTELDALQQKTGSIAWAASLRPEAEHDRLGEVLLASLPRTRDPAQAGTLVWSVGNLKGLSDASRADMTRQLLGAIDTQTDTALGQQYSAMLKQLAAGQSDATRLDELIQMVQDARRVQGQRSSSAPLLDKLLIDMHALQQTSGK